MPKRRTKYHQGKIRSFPTDNRAKPVHLTAFMGYKAGMTHCVRYFEKREGKKTIKKDIVEPVTVVETPPMKVIGMVGYIMTPRGLRALATVYAQELSDGVMRRFYKNYHTAKRNAFKNYKKKYTEDPKSKNHISRDINRIRKYCCVVRVLCATQIEKVKLR
jgi:large subunit ribosomal protein L3e